MKGFEGNERSPLSGPWGSFFQNLACRLGQFAHGTEVCLGEGRRQVN